MRGPMAKLDAEEAARLLTTLGRGALLAGDNPYRARAYLKAAESLAALPEPLDAVIDRGGLRDIPGVGPAIADIIATLSRTGTHPTLEAVRKSYPEGLLDLLSLPGLRPEQA